MAYIENEITGLSLRTKLNNQLTSFINVKDYGAVGNGVTDDATAFQNAVNYMATNGGTMVIPSGTYKINSQITNNSFTQGKNCKIIGVGSVILDFSAMITGLAFDLGCVAAHVEDGTPITVDAIRGDKTITSALSVEKGDIIQIFSTDLWGGFTAGFYKRELARVSSIADGVISLDRGIYDDYDADTTVVINQNSARFEFSNITLKGNPAVNLIGLTVRNFHNIKITDCDFYSFNTSNVSLYGIYGGYIGNNRSCDSIRNGFGYGIAVSICQDLVIESNTITDCRHCIMMGTATRSILVQGNHVSSISGHNGPLDNHESCEYVTFRDNFVWGGGILLRGLNNNIINNTIYNTAGGNGITVQIYGYPNRINKFLNVVGNRIIPAGGTNMFGLEISFDNSNDNVEKVTIADNIFETDESSVYIHADAETTGNVIGTLVFDNNHFIVTGNNPVFHLAASGEISYTNVVINGGRITSPYIGMSMDCTAAGKLLFDNVLIETTNIPVSTVSNIVNFIMRNCYVKSDQYLNILCSGNAVLQNNTLENMIKGGIKINAGVATYTHGGNVKINCIGDVENAATATNDGTDY
jgi:hypothetical protein